MKLRKLTAFAVALVMVLSVMPAFTLSASADVVVDTDVTDADIVEYAKTNGYVFNAQKTTTAAIAGSGEWPSPATSWPETDWTIEGENEGKSAGVWVTGDIYNPALTFRTVNTYRNPAKVTFNEKYGAGKSYVLFSFVPGELAYTYGDIALVDVDGKLITAFRLDYANDSYAINVGWGHTGYNSPFQTSNVYNGYTYTVSNDVSTNITLGSSQIDILIKKVDDTSYQAVYFVDGVAVTTFTYTGTFNGLGGIWGCPTSANRHTNMSLTNPAIYVGNVPSQIAYVTASYRYNVTGDDSVDEIVHTEVRGYDAGDANTKGAWFDEYYYSALGSSLMYKVPGGYLLADGEIDIIQKNPDTGVVLTRVPNWSHDDLQPSDLYTDSVTNKTYMVATRNLVPNGNFEYGLHAWYNGTGVEAAEKNFAVNKADGVIKIINGNTTVSEDGLYNAWALEKGETYLFTYTTTGANAEYAGITQTDVIDTISYDPALATKLVEGTNDVVFEADSDYLKLNIGWSKGAEVGSFGLYKLEVIEPGDVRTTVIQGNAPVLPATVALGEAGVVSEVVWDEAQLSSLELGMNEITGTVIVAEEPTEEPTEEATDVVAEASLEEGNTVTAYVMVYPETFSLEDQVSRNGQKAVRSTGDVAMPQDVTGKFAIEMDVEVSEYGDIWIIFNDSTILNNWYFHNDQILLGFYVDGEITPINGHGDGNRDDQTTLTVAGLNKNYRVFVKGDCDTDKYTVTVTTPDGIARTFEDFGFRMNTDKINSLAVFTNSDGTGSLTVKNIKVYDPEELNAEYRLGDAGSYKALGTSNIGDYFYDEEIAFYDQAKFYTSYTDADTCKDMGHIVKSTMEQKYIVDPTMTPEAPLPVYVEMYKEHAVVYDTFAANTSSETEVPENLLFVGSNGDSDAQDVDDDGNVVMTGGVNVGSPRIPLLTFNIPEVGEDEAVRLNLYVAKSNHNLGEGNEMKLAANGVDLTVDEAAAYVPADVVSLENLVWSDQAFAQSGEGVNGRADVTGNNITIDVTDIVKKAAAEGKETVTFALYAPTAGAYVADRENSVYGGAQQGNAAYLETTEAYTLNILGASKFTKNGSAVQLTNGAAEVVVPVDATMKFYSDDANVVAFADHDNELVYKVNEVVAPRASSESVTPVSLGLAMINGAQVRYGDKVNDEGKVTKGNGLRFITELNTMDSLAGLDWEGLTYGVKITAQGSTNEVIIPAEKMQNDTIFTSAITNLAEGNFNRNFTAIPYLNVDNQEFIGTTPVTRSIYRVAAGILATHDISEEISEDDNDYSMSNQDLVNVLQAYVNQVGIRLTYNPDAEKVFTAREDGSGSYTHLDGEAESAFFDVSYTDNNDGSYSVTIAPMSDFETPVEIKSWWKEYVRINNNNNKVKAMITNDAIAEDGTLTFTFTVAQ